MRYFLLFVILAIPISAVAYEDYYSQKDNSYSTNIYNRGNNTYQDSNGNFYYDMGGNTYHDLHGNQYTVQPSGRIDDSYGHSYQHIGNQIQRY